MADHPPDPEASGDTPGHGAGAGAPGWVKAFWIILLAVVVLFVVLQLVGGGGHGPDRHGAGTGAPPTGMTEAGPVPPFQMGDGGRQP